MMYIKSVILFLRIVAVCGFTMSYNQTNSIKFSRGMLFIVALQVKETRKHLKKLIKWHGSFEKPDRRSSFQYLALLSCQVSLFRIEKEITGRSE